LGKDNDMITQKVLLHQGALEIDYNKAYQPIQISFQDIGNDSIQVDITGKGLLNYDGKLDHELEMEIYTNILYGFKEYSDITGHSSADIGHHLSLVPTKKYNRKHNAYEVDMSASIVFKKPVTGASAYSLQPTITVLSSVIIEEVFIHD
jgi:hypothetical protein